MQIINASYEILDDLDGEKILRNITRYGRTCYKSNGADDAEQDRRFVAARIKAEHESIRSRLSVTVAYLTSLCGTGSRRILRKAPGIVIMKIKG